MKTLKNTHWTYQIIRLMLAVVMLILTAMIGIAQDDDLIGELESAMSRAVDQGFSGVIVVAKDGELIFSEGYGLANREWDIPNTPETVFRIGSITKQFTAMGILNLYEQGKLSLDDSVCDYLDPCPETWQEITIHHLLNNSSGIPDYIATPGYIATLYKPTTPEAIVDVVRDLRLEFEPGDRWRYSSTGYVILGMIIEQVSGQSYADFLQETFFDPLGMTSTGVDTSQAIIPKRADGYAQNENAAYIDMSHPFASGDLYSTALDLLKWNNALYNGEIITDETWDTMWENRIYIDERIGMSYGYGLVRNDIPMFDEISIWHDGNIFGFSSIMNRFPNANIDVIALSNVEQTDVRMVIDPINILMLEANN